MHLCVGGAPLTVDCKNYMYDPKNNVPYSNCLDVGSSGAADPICD
jgi:hypothetical protein